MEYIGYRLYIQFPLLKMRVSSRHDGIRSAPSCTNFIKLQDKLKLAMENKVLRTAPPRVGCLSLEPSRRNNLCPKTGLEPVIALLEGKCLNHLNYSGSYNCCMRLFRKEEYGEQMEWLTGFEPATF